MDWNTESQNVWKKEAEQPGIIIKAQEKHYKKPKIKVLIIFELAFWITENLFHIYLPSLLILRIKTNIKSLSCLCLSTLHVNSDFLLLSSELMTTEIQVTEIATAHTIGNESNLHIKPQKMGIHLLIKFLDHTLPNKLVVKGCNKIISTINPNSSPKVLTGLISSLTIIVRASLYIRYLNFSFWQNL